MKRQRDALVTAYFEHCHGQGTRYMLLVASHPLQEDAASSLGWALDLIRVGLEHSPLSKIHALGLQAGMGSPLLGPAYLQNLLEPTLRCVEVRIERHQARGELVGRALQLVAPLLPAVLHQHALCGDQPRPLDIRALVDASIAGLGR